MALAQEALLNSILILFPVYQVNDQALPGVSEETALLYLPLKETITDSLFNQN